MHHPREHFFYPPTLFSKRLNRMRFCQSRILTLSLLISDMANLWSHADILLLTTSYLFGHRSNLCWTWWNDIHTGTWLLSALKSITLQDMICAWFIHELCFSIHVHAFLARLLLSGAMTDGLMGLCMQDIGEECHENVAWSRLILRHVLLLVWIWVRGVGRIRRWYHWVMMGGCWVCGPAS